MDVMRLGGDCDVAAAGRSRQQASDAAHLERLANLGQLSASIMHEINGPLTYLLLSLESLAAFQFGALEVGRLAS
jgi:C4-dicarboxylate-specific signal transduction histidine kinase